MSIEKEHAPAVTPAPAPDTTTGGGISSRMTTLFAVTAGLAVANIYYAQPLLTAIASTFRVGSATAALVVTLGAVGYALGLAVIVPLGDILDRRKLVVALLGLVAVAQLASAVAPSIAVLISLAAVLSVCAVVGPIAVSFAASLSTAAERGRVTGKVMSGVLLGVLLARTAGGLIAQVGGWRSVYVVAAVLMLVLSAVLYRVLPTLAPAATMRYSSLLASIPRLLAEEPLLRLRCALGFLSFAGFNALWTSIAFLLASQPYSYGEGTIGLFGLAGVVGAYAARLAGGWVDRGRERVASGFLLAAVLVGWGLLALGDGSWLVTVLLGIIVLDLGVQGMQTTNLSVLFRLRPEARSRITTAYMTTYFLGGVAGSAASGVAFSRGGWPAVCAVGALLAVAALCLWAVTALRERRALAAAA